MGLLTYLAGIALVTLARWRVVKIILVASKTGRITAQRMLLIGPKADVASFMTRHQPWNTGLMINGLVIPREAPAGASAAEHEQFLSADLAQAMARGRQSRPDGLFIALPWAEPERILDRSDYPRIIRTGSIASLELTPPALSTPQIITKRVFDFTGTLLLLILLLPLFAVKAMLIKRDSKGPVFFLQRRYGFKQQPFCILKFRTMTCMDDGDHVVQATRNDPRVTRVGARLRHDNIDELPQLLAERHSGALVAGRAAPACAGP